MSSSRTVSFPDMFRFWLPLLGTWWMMAVEGPFLAATIARLADPTPNLAAYGVAFAVAIIVESPVIMLMGAATRLASDSERLQVLWRFTFRLEVAVTIAMAAVVIPGVWRFIGLGVLGLPPTVSALTWKALLFLLPWPLAIADRRFHQGLLIRTGRTRRVAFGTLVRLGAMSVTALLLALSSAVPGAAVGGAALSAGVVAEACATRWMSREAKGEIAAIAPSGREITLRTVASYYAPLAYTMVLSMAVQPMITFFLGQSRMALESLAVQPVIHGLTFLFRSWGLSYQEVAIALIGEEGENRDRVGAFGLVVGIGASIAMATLVFTPLATVWFQGVSGLDPQLAAFALVPARLAAILPLLSAVLSLQRALLMRGDRTGPLGRATVLELLVLALALWTGIHLLDAIGAVVAVAAMIAGRLASNAALWMPCMRVWRSLGGAR